MKKCIPLALTFFSFYAFSADIEFNWLKSTSGNNSALSGACNYISDTSDLNCNLRQIMVRKKAKKEDVDAQVKNLKVEIEAPEEFAKVKKQFLTEMCPKMSEASAQMDDLVAVEKFRKICKTPSKENFIDALTYMYRVDERTCKVMDYDVGNFVFEQVNENKWVATNKPSGQCGVVNVMSLERHPDYSSLWSYSQVRHYTNTETQFCKELSAVNEPITNSWNGKSSIKMNCEYVEFGL